ncbi:MAG TPA: hypothetical protein VHT27_06130 [Solirubrobacteraceae bacterium]|jgi:hypothetical protein|nr:hypothetical protein [Solirubrobacteraceae bacterium]
MLFDLRGRGRRRTVRVIYTGLALLMGVGLVGFGVGGGFGGGGILSGVSNNEGGGSTSFSGKVKQYRKLTRQQPANAAAWEKLTEALLHESNQYTQSGVSTKGKEVFAEVSEAWQHYLALNPPKPSTSLASQVLLVYSEEGLNQPANAAAALQIVVAARPSASLYSELAVYAYKAKALSEGDLAAKQAVSLAPSNERKRLQTELAELRANPNAQKTYTTTTNGKTYAVQKAPNGAFTGTEIKKTPAPTTTAKK